MTIVGFDKTRI